MNDQSSNSNNRAMMLLAFFTLLNVVNFVDRNLVLGFSSAIIEDLDLTYTQFGLLTGIAFTAFYTFVGIILGMMADRFNRPRLIAIGLFVWSLMTAASGAARNFVHMGAARILVGAGEATLTPTALSLLSDVMPPERRAMASGVYYMGVPLGTGAGLVVAGILGPMIGWRNAFYAMGVIGIALCAAVLLVKDPPRGGMDAKDGEALEAHETFGAVARDLFGALKISPALCWALFGSVLTHIGLSATYFDIRWLEVERGFTEPGSAPITVGGIYTIAGSLSVAFSGLLADKFHERWPGGKFRFLVLVQLLSIPFGITYRFADSSHWLFYVCLFFAAAAATAFYGPVFSAVQDLSPVLVRSTAVAFLLFVSNMFGIGFGSWATGRLIDTLQARGVAEPMTYGTLSFVLIGMTSSVAYYFAGRYYQSSKKRLDEVYG